MYVHSTLLESVSLLLKQQNVYYMYDALFLKMILLKSAKAFIIATWDLFLLVDITTYFCGKYV